MTPGNAALCDGTVMHRRMTPAVHEFRSAVSYVWIDPEHPEDLCAAHPLWSSTRPAPVRFRRRDYGFGAGSLTDSVRNDLAPILGDLTQGPVRMLTQVRHWGWLFNPITVYVAWDDPNDDPVGVVLEVTNTPWKERLRYPILLNRDGEWLTGATDKVLHVSPFLDEDHRYDVRLRSAGNQLEFGISVTPSGADAPVLVTGLTVERAEPTRRALTTSLLTRVASTHRVSLGIHWQAFRLWIKRVPFVLHPGKRKAVS